ncbi:MAG: hotdog fold thioesterase [Bacteroidota bacterium]
MSIWFNKHLRIEDLSLILKDTMAEHLSMEFVEIGNDFLKMKMPVDARTKQPYGLLHGGASCSLSETVGSIAAHLVVDANKFSCVGLEINANHIRSARQGFVTAIATPLHLGTNTHVWDIKISDESDKLICISRLTIAVLKKAF